MLIDIKLKKKSIAELGHNGRLKNIRQPTHLSPFLQNGRVYLAEILYEVPSQQKIWDQQGPHMEFYMGPKGHLIWDWDGICNTIPCGTHMGKPIWVTIWEPYGSYSGFGPRGLCQPTFVE